MDIFTKNYHDDKVTSIISAIEECALTYIRSGIPEECREYLTANNLDFFGAIHRFLHSQYKGDTELCLALPSYYFFFHYQILCSLEKLGCTLAREGNVYRVRRLELVARSGTADNKSEQIYLSYNDINQQPNDFKNNAIRILGSLLSAFVSVCKIKSKLESRLGLKVPPITTKDDDNNQEYDFRWYLDLGKYDTVVKLILISPAAKAQAKIIKEIVHNAFCEQTAIHGSDCMPGRIKSTFCPMEYILQIDINIQPAPKAKLASSHTPALS